MVLLYLAVKHLKDLGISPIEVVPQHNWCPRTIVHYTFYNINGETIILAPGESMQFGHALERILYQILNADPRHGYVFMGKVDIANGFYRLHVAPKDIPNLGVAFWEAAHSKNFVAFPLTAPMGWKESPPWFTAAT